MVSDFSPKQNRQKSQAFDYRLLIQELVLFDRCVLPQYHNQLPCLLAQMFLSNFDAWIVLSS